VTGTLRILSGGAAQGLVEEVRPAFEAETGCRIDGTFGAVGVMRDLIVTGDPADLVILSRALIDELGRGGHLLNASIADVATVATAVAVRSGDPVPGLADSWAVRAALLAADAIHFPDPRQATAGIHFARVMQKLGIDRDVAGRLRPAANGATAMRELAQSTAQRPIGCTQATEIRATPGLTLAGPLPPGLDLTTVYAAAVTARATSAGPAIDFIARLRDRRS
jgi:molybdate transport system substrate-binding protein